MSTVSQVTSSAYQNLGAFIATFSNPNKSHCELLPDGSINNLLSLCQLPNKSTTCKDQSVKTNSSVSEESDISNYNTFMYWKQPVPSTTQATTVSSFCLSLKDIDLNSSEQSTKSDNIIPDLSEYKQVGIFLLYTLRDKIILTKLKM